MKKKRPYIMSKEEKEIDFGHTFAGTFLDDSAKYLYLLEKSRYLYAPNKQARDRIRKIDSSRTIYYDLLDREFAHIPDDQPYDNNAWLYPGWYEYLYVRVPNKQMRLEVLKEVQELRAHEKDKDILKDFAKLGKEFRRLDKEFVEEPDDQSYISAGHYDAANYMDPRIKKYCYRANRNLLPVVHEESLYKLVKHRYLCAPNRQSRDRLRKKAKKEGHGKEYAFDDYDKEFAHTPDDQPYDTEGIGYATKLFGGDRIPMFNPLAYVHLYVRASNKPTRVEILDEVYNMGARATHQIQHERWNYCRQNNIKQLSTEKAEEFLSRGKEVAGKEFLKARSKIKAIDKEFADVPDDQSYLSVGYYDRHQSRYRSR